MDRFEAMSMFLAALDHGSLSAAARALGVPLATLSRKVADLETRLGAQLLIRTPRSLSATDAGLAYAVAARKIMAELGEAEREVKGEFSKPSGELVITAPFMFGRLHVLPVVSDFLAEFPDVNVRLVLGDRNAALIDNHIDMAVRIGALPDSGLIATRVGAVRPITCASPGLIEAHGLPLKPADVARMPCALTDLQIVSRGWTFRDPDSDAPLFVPITPRLVAPVETVLDAALRGVGLVNLLHYQVRAAIETGSLVPVLEEYERGPAPIHLIHPGRGQMPLKMRCFLDFAAPRLREVLLIY